LALRIRSDHIGQNDRYTSEAEIKKNTGKNYDRAVLEILFNNDDIVSDEFIEKQFLTDALEPGMMLNYNLFHIQYLSITGMACIL
jgi:hypothetical protein